MHLVLISYSGKRNILNAIMISVYFSAISIDMMIKNILEVDLKEVSESRTKLLGFFFGIWVNNKLLVPRHYCYKFSMKAKVADAGNDTLSIQLREILLALPMAQ